MSKELEEAIKELNKYRNFNYKSDDVEERKIALALNELLPAFHKTLKELDELKKKVLNLADGVAYLGYKDMYNGVQFEISEELKRLCKGVDE